ncbi:MAG: 2-oxoglutarate dehydrogenase complex dihydrolipoyllysine-residue succinyltransferase [Gemmatimonadota bacterium]
MTIDVDVPEMGESVTEVVLLEWLKQDGEYVERDEPICVLETDKANVDLPAPAAGVLHPIAAVEATLEVGALIARIEEGVVGAESRAAATTAAVAPAAETAPAPTAGVEPPPATPPSAAEEAAAEADLEGLSPAVRRLLEEHHVDPAIIQGTGRGGRLIKQDVTAYLKERERAARDAEVLAPAPIPAAKPLPHFRPPGPPPHAEASPPPVRPATPARPPVPTPAGEGTRREPMSRIRKRIAERLLAAQRTAAMLTTFNEIDLSQVMDLRKRHKEAFQEKHGVSLGLMSFFSRACILALQEYPDVNASVEGEEVVYHDYVNLGIAVSSERGLLVPVLRQAQSMSMARVESEIKRLAAAARDNKLTLEELGGGTFTITNGGIFGSLLSTPILTPPQTGILGMHATKERPVAVSGQVVVRPMMYVALTYDHRLIDGRTSVTFLVRLKELLEDPTRLLLEV